MKKFVAVIAHLTDSPVMAAQALVEHRTRQLIGSVPDGHTPMLRAAALSLEHVQELVASTL